MLAVKNLAILRHIESGYAKKRGLWAMKWWEDLKLSISYWLAEPDGAKRYSSEPKSNKWRFAIAIGLGVFLIWAIITAIDHAVK